MPKSRHIRGVAPNFQQLAARRAQTNDQLLDLNTRLQRESDWLKKQYNGMAVQHNNLVKLMVGRNGGKPVQAMIEEFSRVPPGLGVVVPHIELGFWTFEWDTNRRLPLMETSDNPAAKPFGSQEEKADGQGEQEKAQESEGSSAGGADGGSVDPAAGGSSESGPSDADLDAELESARRDLGIPTRGV